MDLHNYQKVGRDWLAKKKVALLADDMGLGKSAQAITAADAAAVGRLLVLCPAVAAINWLREFAKFSPDGARRFHLCQSGRENPPGDRSLICSYGIGVNLHKAGKLSGAFDLAILDEFHFLSSIEAARSRVVLGRTGIVRSCRRVWALTGTPMRNHPGELWPLLRTFGRTKLSYQEFIRRFCVFAAGSSWTDPRPMIVGLNRKRADELKELLRPIMLRRQKKDVELELPPVTFADVQVLRRPVKLEDHASFLRWVFPTDRSEELLAAMAKQANRLETEMDAAGINSDDFGLMMEAMANSLPELRRYTGLQKIDAVAEMLDWELSNGYYDKVVVFAIHRDVIEGLRQRLTKYHPLTLYGKTDPKTRQRNIDRFQDKKKWRVMICNIHAAGTAITLTAASEVVFVEQSWTPADNAQACMRVHRIGQKRKVNCRFIGLADSLDEKIANILNRKTRDIVRVFDGDDGLEPEEMIDWDE